MCHEEAGEESNENDHVKEEAAGTAEGAGEEEEVGDCMGTSVS